MASAASVLAVHRVEMLFGQITKLPFPYSVPAVENWVLRGLRGEPSGSQSDCAVNMRDIIEEIHIDRRGCRVYNSGRASSRVPFGMNISLPFEISKGVRTG